MTNEKIIKTVLQLKANVSDNVKNEIIDALIAELENESRRAAAKKSGHINVYKACERYIKSSKKIIPGRECMHGFYKSDKCDNVLCNGYSAARLFTVDFETTRAPIGGGAPLEVAQLFDALSNDLRVDDLIPDINALKEELKIQKTRINATNLKKDCRPVINFGYNLPFVNLEYLINMMEILPGAKIYVNSKSAKAPIYFICDNGNDGLLLPMLKNEAILNKYNSIGIDVSDKNGAAMQ